MNIDDARSQRRDLERQIVEMILAYERDTGLAIAGIFINKVAVGDNPTYPPRTSLQVKVDVEL